MHVPQSPTTSFFRGGFLRRRIFTILLVGLLALLGFGIIFQDNTIWQRLGLSKRSSEVAHKHANNGRSGRADIDFVRAGGVHRWLADDGTLAEPKFEDRSAYPQGKLKPAGSNYTKCLVMAKTEDEDTSWITDELADMLDSGALTTAVYHVDDKAAALHVERNKGREAMVYLTYVIDNYDQLADINLFMHAHRVAWHNNELLGADAALTVRLLSAERVTRDGYMNLRCHWVPGCPDWIQASDKLYNPDRAEEYLLATRWEELFPGTRLPSRIAQPCCAQFAVSRERIRAIPRKTFVHLRDWLSKTELSDQEAGRVFEYTWQYIFGGSAVHCPSMSACYCDGFGVCFGDYRKFDAFFELRFRRDQDVARLREGAADGQAEVELLRSVAEADAELQRLLDAALELGRDPRQRALESGREWRDGEGY